MAAISPAVDVSDNRAEKERLPRGLTGVRRSLDDVNVQVFGSEAMLTAKMTERMEDAAAGKGAQAVSFISHMWTQRNGVWQLHDVTIVSATLAAYLILGEPHIAVNSRVVYPAYFLALGATCLRYDTRVCLLATGLAMAQYAAIVAVAATGWELNDAARWAPFPYGTVSGADQASRVILLGAAGVLATAVVWRIARLRHLSVVDRLTGLPNRGYLDARFAASEYYFASNWHPEQAPSRLPERTISAGAPRTILFTLGLAL